MHACAQTRIRMCGQAGAKIRFPPRGFQELEQNIQNSVRYFSSPDALYKGRRMRYTRERGLSPRGKIPFRKVCQDAPVGTDDTFRRKTLDKSRVDYNSRQSWKMAFEIVLFREALRVYRSGNDGKAHISPNPARRVEQDARQSKQVACKQMQDIT